MARRPFPSNAVDVDVQLGDRQVRRRPKRDVLVVGEVAIGIRSELMARGCALTLAATLSDAFVALLDGSFAAVLLDPVTAVGAMDLVNAIKENADAHLHTVATLYGPRRDAKFLRGVRPPSQAQLELLRQKHAATPFVVMPMPDEGGWYAVVIVVPRWSLRYDPALHPLTTLVATIDGPAMIDKASGPRGLA